MRIAVVGTTGSGKTTLARRLSQALAVPHIEQDALHWGPNWTMRPRETFRAELDAQTQKAGWVVEGNYSFARDLVWPRAEILIWLDRPFPVMFARLLSRTVRRAVTKEPLYAGNTESWRQAFFSRESILLWQLNTFRRRRTEIPALLALPEHKHLRAHRIRTDRELEGLMTALTTR